MPEGRAGEAQTCSGTPRTLPHPLAHKVVAGCSQGSAGSGEVSQPLILSPRILRRETRVVLVVGCLIHACSGWCESASKSAQPLCFARSQSLGLCEKFC